MTITSVVAPAEGEGFATDLIGSVHHPLSKTAFGAEGAVELVSDTNPLPVWLTNGTAVQVGGNIVVTSSALPTGAATETTLAAINAKLPALQSAVPDAGTAAQPCREVGQDTIVVSFVASGSGLRTDKMSQLQLGTGMVVSQANGSLVLTTGTTANSEFLARSVSTWKGANIASFRHILSQRIANQNFVFMVGDLVGEGLSFTINSATSVTVTVPGHSFVAADAGQFIFLGGISGANGIPGRYAIASVVAGVSITFTVASWPASGSGTLDLFGYNSARIQFSGTTATNGTFQTQRRGWQSETDTAINCNTTASPGHMVQLTNTGRDIYVQDMLTASSTVAASTARGSRYDSIPDDQTAMYFFIWSYNGSTAPASTTTWTVGGWSVETFSNLPVFLAGNRMQGSTPPMPVFTYGNQNVSIAGTNTPTLAAGTNLAADVGMQYRANATGAAFGAHLVSAASTNLTVVKASAGRLVGWSLANTNAAWRYVKFHNQTTTPTAGSGVVRTIAIPPNGRAEGSFPGGIAFTTGIGMSTVTGAADSDTTAVNLNDIVGDIFYA